MATIVGKVGGWLLDKVNDVMANEVVSQISTSPLNKLWILPLVLRKINGTEGMEKDNSTGSEADAFNKAITTTNPSGKGDDKIYEYTNPVRDLVNKTKKLESITQSNIDDLIKGTSENYPQKLKTLANVKGESIFKAYKPNKNEIIIMNISTTPYICITLQNRPPEIDVDPQSTWVEVRSMGRNVPFMMYTGASDTLSFDISWFSNQKDRRDDVITKCRLLESWTKSNGYNAAPPILKIKWGSSDIFTSAYFILYSAKYTLSNFQDSCVEDVNSGFEYDDKGIATGYNAPGIISSKYDARMNSRLNVYRNGKSPEFVDLKLLPAMAVQHLVFKRVSQENIDYSMIDYANTYKGIDGINQSK